MTEPSATQDEPLQAHRHSGRRLRDIATVLPLALLLLVLPPYVRIFDQDSFLNGIPLLLIYIFGLWALVILASGLLSRNLVQHEMADRLGEGGETGRHNAPKRDEGPERGA
ncbi:MAG: hypothetical protein ACTS10_07935 [Kiloniellales bacterium]